MRSLPYQDELTPNHDVAKALLELAYVAGPRIVAPHLAIHPVDDFPCKGIRIIHADDPSRENHDEIEELVRRIGDLFGQ